ncbi:hypothetical protein [Pelagibius sp. Alg239-R121]|uniref:hypothetical protein n=1 Tax=Pelagibius sp. Alg239-R121 TaxID=2993448 RepID=UPI0024A6819C|nr:hypothetical protein [Pelagibius sp. Alg239-R121]
MFIYFFGPSIIGFLVGLVLAVNHRENRSKCLKAAKRELAELIKGKESELPSLADEIIEIFERHDHQLIERSHTEIAFRYPPLFDGWVALGAYWAAMAMMSLGGVVAAYLSALLFCGFNQRITMRLY